MKFIKKFIAHVILLPVYAGLLGMLLVFSPVIVGLWAASVVLDDEPD